MSEGHVPGLSSNEIQSVNRICNSQLCRFSSSSFTNDSTSTFFVKSVSPHWLPGQGQLEVLIAAPETLIMLRNLSTIDARTAKTRTGNSHIQYLIASQCAHMCTCPFHLARKCPAEMSDSPPWNKQQLNPSERHRRASTQQSIIQHSICNFSILYDSVLHTVNASFMPNIAWPQETQKELPKRSPQSWRLAEVLPRNVGLDNTCWKNVGSKRLVF